MRESEDVNVSTDCTKGEREEDFTHEFLLSNEYFSHTPLPISCLPFTIHRQLRLQGDFKYISFIISPLTSFFVSYLDVRNFLLVGAADLRHILKTCALRNRKERKTKLNVCALHEIGASVLPEPSFCVYTV